ncbi:MAG: GNAT family N-acetyltransferase [Anaerolineales bacterium]
MSIADYSAPIAWLDEITIRQATQGDLTALEWEGAYTHFRRVYARAFERSRRGAALLWVAERDPGILLGQLFVLLESEVDRSVADGCKRAFIHSFRVRPDYQRAGLGSRLMQHTEANLFQRSFQWVFLHVACENERAIRFYERCGYNRLSSVTGDWSYEDHLGVVRHVVEPGWRMAKLLTALRPE